MPPDRRPDGGRGGDAVRAREKDPVVPSPGKVPGRPGEPRPVTRLEDEHRGGDHAGPPPAEEPDQEGRLAARTGHHDRLSGKGAPHAHGRYHSRVKEDPKPGSPRALLGEAGLAPLKRFGQNFMADANMRELLLREARPGPDALVLEIGAGLGLFTAEIARLAGHVVAVELDRRLVPLARAELSVHPNVTLVAGDALAPDRESLSPAVREALSKKLVPRGPFQAVRVLSNLPYNGAATMIVALLESGVPIDRMVVTVQKEVAERIAAKPGDRGNGALTLLVQSLAEVRILRRVPPSVFWPRPKVESAALEITVRHAFPSGEEWRAFKRTLDALFRHPRKALAGSLRESHPDAAEILGACGIEPRRRPQTLTVEEARCLSAKL